MATGKSKAPCVCVCVCVYNIVKPNFKLWNTKSNMKYEIIYQLDAIEYLFVFLQLDMFRAYTPIFRSNGCYNFFTYAAYGVL